MLIVTGTIDVGLEDVEAAKAAAAEMALATRTEAGCIAYAFWQNVEDPARFRVYEEWEDLASLEAHFVTSHMAKFREALGKLDIQARRIVRFEPGTMTAL